MFARKKSGFSLIESLIGTALMLVVFLSIFGVFNLSIKLVGKTKAKAGAVALANERMEMIRNLPYKEVGTLGGMVPGNIPQTETIVLNGIEYTRKVDVRYVDDPKDGEGVSDENGIEADYKAVRVELDWLGASKPVVFVSNVVPAGIETVDGGGTLKINVFDASALPVVSALAHIENQTTNPAVLTDVYANDQGKIVFPGVAASSGYEVTISKDGYSSALTYGADSQNVSPDPGHLSIFEGQTTEASFVIDKLSSKTVRTFEPIKEFVWRDDFDDWSKVSDYASTTPVGGAAVLEEETPGSYWGAGYLKSLDVDGGDYLAGWKEFSWNDSAPANTAIKYQVLYNSGSDWIPIPDGDLPGNESGFENSPVDLSGLSVSAYPALRLRADLETGNANMTPSLLDWKISWDAGPTPLPDIAFNMRGEKTIGKDSAGDPIYKYSENLSTGPDGTAAITGLEFDVYGITVDGSATGYDISESCPFQPVSIAPNSSVTVDLTMVAHADNTFLVSVKDGSGDVVAGAGARLYGSGYDETKDTSDCGQAFFTPLSAGSYTIEISKTGYDTASFPVDISGQTTLRATINES
ncbi:MAG: hypothetical protein GXP44_00605 [bacterium]|nr:hypothetical protein [bacterium]